MNNLKDIHNLAFVLVLLEKVVLSGFQWTIWRIYTTVVAPLRHCFRCFIRISMNNLKDIHNLSPAEHMTAGVVLSGFQWTIWRIYTTSSFFVVVILSLFYQDFNEQFEGYTQHDWPTADWPPRCFIRISMNNSAAKVQKILEICKFTKKYFVISQKSITFAPTNLKDIHNKDYSVV